MWFTPYWRRSPIHENFFLFLIVALISTPVWAESKGSVYDKVINSGTIRCGYFVWPPYIVKDPNTEALSGINYDFMEEIGRVLDLKIDWAEEVSAGTAIEGLNANRYDVMCASLWPDPARLKHGLLTSPEFYSTVYVVTREDDTRFDGGKTAINDPAVTIGGIDGDITYTLARSKYPDANVFALPQMSDPSQLLLSLATGKVDIVLVDKGTVHDYNETNDVKLKIAADLPPVSVFSEVLAVRKGEFALQQLLNNALRIVVDSGKADDFVRKYKQYRYFAPQKSWQDEQ